jgi:hypothetical protein
MRIDENSSIDKAFIGNVLCRESRSQVRGTRPKQASGRPVDSTRNRVRVKSKFLRRFKLIWVVRSCAKKYFACAVGQIKSTSSAVPR